MIKLLEIQKNPEKIKMEMEATMKQLNQLEQDHQVLDKHFQIQMRKAELEKIDFQKHISYLKLQLQEQQSRAESEREKIDQLYIQIQQETEMHQKAKQKIAHKDQQIKLLEQEMNDKVSYLKQQFQNLKKNQSKHLELRDQEILNLNRKFEEIYEQQKQEFQNQLYTWQNQINDLRSQVESELRDKYLLQDQLQKFHFHEQKGDIDLKNTLEQLQSQLTFERIKAAETITNLNKKLDSTNQKFSEIIDNKIQQISILEIKGIDLLRQLEDSQIQINTMENNQENMFENFRKDSIEIIQTNLKSYRMTLIKQLFISAIKERAMKANFLMKLKEQEDKFKSENSKISRFYDINKKLMNVQEIIKGIDKLNEYQLEVVKEKFRQDAWNYVRLKRGEREVELEQQIAKIQFENQKQSIEMAKQKQITQQLQMQIQEQEEQIQQLKISQEEKEKHFLQQIKMKEQEYKREIDQLSKWYKKQMEKRDSNEDILQQRIAEQFQTIDKLKKKNINVNQYFLLFISWQIAYMIINKNQWLLLKPPKVKLWKLLKKSLLIRVITLNC